MTPTAAVHLPAVALALLQVVQLVAPLPVLLRPDVMLRGFARRPAA